MALKTFNYTDDKYIEGVDTRAEIAALAGNKGYAFVGDVETQGSTITVKAGSVAIVGGLCARVTTDESFSTSAGRYIVVETDYSEVPAPNGEGNIEHYTCSLRSVSAVSEEMAGEVRKHYMIYDTSNGKSKGPVADDVDHVDGHPSTGVWPRAYDILIGSKFSNSTPSVDMTAYCDYIFGDDFAANSAYLRDIFSVYNQKTRGKRIKFVEGGIYYCDASLVTLANEQFIDMTGAHLLYSSGGSTRGYCDIHITSDNVTLVDCARPLSTLPIDPAPGIYIKPGSSSFPRRDVFVHNCTFRKFYPYSGSWSSDLVFDGCAFVNSSFVGDNTEHIWKGTAVYTPGMEYINCELDSGWITMNLINGATPLANIPKYRNKGGIVYLTGGIQKQSNPIATILPKGYRPAQDLTFSTLNSGNTLGVIKVQSDGSILLFDSTANLANSFIADN